MGKKLEKYTSYTDEQLIQLLRDGDHEVMDYMCERYKDLVRGKARSMFILGGDNEDLIQEGMLGLFKAMRDYDSGRDASFRTFADLCVSRQIYTAVQASRRDKHIPLNTYISLYAKAGESAEGEERSLLDSIEDPTGFTPEEQVLDRERVADLERTIDTELSDFEKQVLDLFLTGMSYTEIARVLGREEKSTDNALQRIKSKLRARLPR